jgi:Ca2+-binding RTX toxin-like protein
VDPTAVDDSATVPEDSGPTPIDVLANDPDPDGGEKAIVAAGQPGHGAVAITGGGSGLTYQPPPGWCGQTSFTYTLNGGSTATVAVTVTCAPEPPVRKCDGVTANRQGSAGRDVINGSPRRDVIVAFGGNDLVRGLGGNDLICGGAGSDTVAGGDGRDRLLGGAGGDTLKGGPARDTLLGGRGRDRLFGGPGRDVERQ